MNTPQPIIVSDDIDLVETIAAFLWGLTDSTCGGPSWLERGEEELKERHREAARIIIHIMPIILNDHD